MQLCQICRKSEMGVGPLLYVPFYIELSSGLYEILANNNLWIIGTWAVVNANHIKQAIYCLQVAVSAVYMKLKAATPKSGPITLLIEWLQERKKPSQMCFYWDMIVKLQIDILLYIKTIRQSNFDLYALCLKHLIKWLFLMDHYHYAQWCTVHLMDLFQLNINCSNIYSKFSNGNFSFQKTVRQFSKMAPDQVHELKKWSGQRNKWSNAPFE